MRLSLHFRIILISIAVVAITVMVISLTSAYIYSEGLRKAHIATFERIVKYRPVSDLQIGLRLAVGARRRDVMLQFLVEAMVMSLIGGVLGVGFGLVSARTLTAILDWPTDISAGTLAAAFGIAAAIGIVFGYYPARRASRLDPIESLRYE